MLTVAPKTLEAWIEAIQDADIPVLAQTAIAIEAMHEREDDIAARDIGIPTAIVTLFRPAHKIWG